MTEAELRTTLANMLAEERSAEPDWARVEFVALDAIHRLNMEPAPDHPVAIYRFLDDVDIRRKEALAGDRAYADGQCADVEAYLGGN